MAAYSYFRFNCAAYSTRARAAVAFASHRRDTDREFSANFDRQASATDSVLFLGLSPPKANKTVSFFVLFHQEAMQSGILFLVSIERGGSRRVYNRGPLLFDMSQLGDAPCRRLARPGGSALRCRRTVMWSTT